MRECYICKSVPCFLCRCADDLKFMCEYHLGFHQNHSEVKFFYNDSLEQRLSQTMKNLENLIIKINININEVIESQERLINSLKEQFSFALNKLNSSKIEVQNCIELLKNIKPEKETEFLAIHGYLANINLPVIEGLVDINDRTGTVSKKFCKFLKVRILTENLIRKGNFIIFDEEFFKFELNKKNLRFSFLKKLDKQVLKDFGLYVIFDSNINKRTSNFISINNDNELIKVDIYSAISLYCSKINRFFIINPSFDRLHYSNVLNILKGFQSVEFVKITNMINDEQDLHLLYDALKNKKVVKHVSLKGNMIIATEISNIVSCFTRYEENLRTLNLNSNFFSVDGTKVLASCLPKYKRLRCLNIANNDLGPEGAFFLMSGLSQTRLLEDLNIKSNALNPEGIGYVMKSVSLLSHLSVINISNNNGYDEGAMVIASFLTYMKMLMVLIVDTGISEEAELILCSSCNPYTEIIKSDGREVKISIKKPVFS